MTFDYRCTNCKHTGEHWVKKSDDSVKCPECGELLVKIPSITGIFTQTSPSRVGKSK